MRGTKAKALRRKARMEADQSGLRELNYYDYANPQFAEFPIDPSDPLSPKVWRKVGKGRPLALAPCVRDIYKQLKQAA